MPNVFERVQARKVTGTSAPSEGSVFDRVQKRRLQTEATVVPEMSPEPEPDTWSWENIKQSAYETSPLRLFDAENAPSAAGGIVGGVLMGTGVGAPLAVPASMAVSGGLTKLLGGSNEDAVKNAAWELAGPVGGALVGKGLKTAGKALIRTGLNHGTKTVPEIDEIVETAIAENISPGRRGWFKATERIDQLNQGVREMVESLNDRTINPNTALGNIRRLRGELERAGALQSELDAVDSVLADYGARFRDPLAPIAAHELKADVQERIAKSYVQDVPSAANEARQKFASGLRESIEQAGKDMGMPQIGPVNERVGRLRDLRAAMPTHPSSSRLQGGDVAAVSMFGPKAGIARMALRPKAQAYLGLKMARTGRYLDPFGSLNEGAWQLAQPGVRPVAPAPRTLDQLGIPETAGPAWQRDALDAVGVPVEREVSSPEEMWELALRQERGPTLSPGPRSDFPLETQVTYTPEEIALLRAGVPKDALADDSWVRLASPSRTEASTVTRGTDPLEVLQQTNPHTLDQVGVPLGRREAPWAPDQLDALGIPQTDPGRATSDELWLRQLAGKERGRLGSRTEDIAQRTGVHANQPGVKTAVNNASPNTITATSVKEMHARLQRVRKELEAAMKARTLKQQDLF